MASNWRVLFGTSLLALSFALASAQMTADEAAAVKADAEGPQPLTELGQSRPPAVAVWDLREGVVPLR